MQLFGFVSRLSRQTDNFKIDSTGTEVAIEAARLLSRSTTYAISLNYVLLPAQVGAENDENFRISAGGPFVRVLNRYV